MDAITPGRSLTPTDPSKTESSELQSPKVESAKVESAKPESAKAETPTAERRVDDEPAPPDAPRTVPKTAPARPGHAETEDTSDTPDADADKKPKQSWGQYFRQRPWLILLLIAVFAAVVIAGVLWWLHARQYESTDDAFIDARTISIGSQVAGAIANVPVTDNQQVKAGTLLTRIDDAPYQARLDQAQAQVEEAQANIANLDAQLSSQQSRIDQAKKQVTEAQAALSFSQQENTRYSDLLQKGAGTEQRAQQATSDLTQKEASFGSAQLNAVTAQKQLAVLKTQRAAADAQLKAAQAGRELAATNLGYTKVTAPVDGRVTKLTGAKGTYVQPGQSIMMFVPDTIWITANFKETQLDLMRPGQPVDIEVDAYPDHAFKGHIDSLQSGSGTAFSLLPAENATGNYIKVVQRVPVKIVFDQQPDVLLGPGMSVVPTVKVR